VIVVSMPGPDAGPPAAATSKAVRVKIDRDHLLDVRDVRGACDALASWLDAAASEVHEAYQLIQAGNAYETWSIPKRNGDARRIDAPREPLKGLQRRVLDRLLYRAPVSNAAHGFVPSRSIVTGARVHLPTARTVFNVDLKDAFPSVDVVRVKHLMTRYVTIPLLHLGMPMGNDRVRDVVRVLTSFVTHNGALPQGAPTSGCLLNLACVKVDKYIYKYLSERLPQAGYTRYADDLTISSPGEIPDYVRQEIQKIIRNCGFRVNADKVHYADAKKGQRLEVTGLYLERGKIRIPRERIDQFRAMIHQMAQIPKGQLSDGQRLEVQSSVAFVKMVYGQLPRKVFAPFQKFAEVHGARMPGSVPPVTLDMYPTATA
jgi:hypothetical protein